jgi:hypothetical protein
MVSAFFLCFCGLGMHLHTGNEAALHHRPCLLAEAMYLVGQKTDWYLKLQGIFTKVNRGVRLERAIDKEVGYGE